MFNFIGLNFKLDGSWKSIPGGYEILQKEDGTLTKVRYNTDKKFDQEDLTKSVKAIFKKAIKTGPYERVETITPVGMVYHYEAKIQCVLTAR